jgi:predicted Zn-dependent protease
MLARAQIDSAGFANFFSRIGEEEGGASEWFSSHPASGKRAQRVISSSQGKRDTRPALSPESWQAVVQACREAPAPGLGLRDLLF